jgi:hypothetical protein
MDKPKKHLLDNNAKIHAEWTKWMSHGRKVAFTKTDVDLICHKKPYYRSYECPYGGGHYHLTKTKQKEADQ